MLAATASECVNAAVCASHLPDRRDEILYGHPHQRKENPPRQGHWLPDGVVVEHVSYRRDFCNDAITEDILRVVEPALDTSDASRGLSKCA